MATYSGRSPLNSPVTTLKAGKGMTGVALANTGVLETVGPSVQGADVGGGTPPTYPLIPSTTHPGLKVLYHGDTWFDRIHIIPRDKLKFGNILAFQVQDFEIFNAYRKTQATLNSITNGLGDGAGTNDISAPSVLDPFTSFLDAASTRLNPIKTQLQVQKDGAPTFDGALAFNFSTGDVASIFASGNRIAIWPIKPESGFEESMEFLSDVMTSMSGKEQRLSLRSKPREGYLFDYRLSDDSRQRAQVFLQGWQSNLWALPMFQSGGRLTAPVAIGATSMTVDTTTNRDYRVGGQAVLYVDEQIQEVVTITAITSTTIEFLNTPVLREHTVHTEVFPARLCYIKKAVAGKRYAVNVEDFRIEWQVWDNDTGALSPDASAFPSYNSKVLFECNLMGSNAMRLTHNANVRFVDNGTGKIKAYSRWAGTHKRSSTQGFFLRSRQEIIEAKQLLMELQGKQKSFYLPSFIGDMRAMAGFLSTDTDLSVNGMDMERFIGANIQHPHKIVRIHLSNGTILTRTIVSVAKNGDTLDTITLDAPYGVDATLEEITKVEFLEQVRFDVDRFTLRYERPGQATLVAPVITVYD